MRSYEGRGESVLDHQDAAPVQLTHPCNRSVTCRDTSQVTAGERYWWCGFSGGVSTLHAVGAELLPGQVDGVVVLLGVTLLLVLEI